jgi:hypothetical protein
MRNLILSPSQPASLLQYGRLDKMSQSAKLAGVAVKVGLTSINASRYEELLPLPQ